MLLGVFTCSGCATLPSFGPDSGAISSGAIGTLGLEDDMLPFSIVEISASTLPNAAHPTAAFPASFRNQGFSTSDEKVQVADHIEIRIWEVAPDGLFASAGRRETVLNAHISNSGQIVVPYVEAFRAVGLTTSELRARLLEAYKGQAVEPEIAVRISETASRSASILGAVRSPGKFNIPSNGIAILDFLAQSGGTPHPDWETLIEVQRGRLTASLSLSDIVGSPSNNIVILPGDILNVSHNPRRFAVYGAIAQSGNFEVPTAKADLSYLLAEVGGLDAMVSEAKSVFVFRQIEGQDAIAYRVDFSRPDAFFLADTFTLNPSDIVYVASSDASDFRNFVSIVLSPIFGTAAQAQKL